ncbi:MAG: YdbH domain-containing protein [Erythrobacter sp.]
MPVAIDEQMEGPRDGSKRRFWPRRWRTRFVAGVALFALIGGGAVWLRRERIAGDAIDDYLASKDVPATYDIVAIGPRQQVIENLVIGDPARPDVTVKRVVIETGVGWAGPELRRATIEGARVFATFKGGKFSLGALDPLIFTESKEPPALPAIVVTLRDARGLLESDYGALGWKLEGEGRIDDGFVGKLAATAAPGIGVDGCRVGRATLYGALTTTDGAPGFDGPLRLADLACGGARLAQADIGTKASLRRDFAAADADFRIEGARAALAEVTGAALAGTAKLSWSDGRLAVGHDLALNGLVSSQGKLATLAAEGSWRGTLDGSSGQWEGVLRGTGLAPASDLTARLVAAERGAKDTLIAPLLAKARAGLSRSIVDASFSADAIIRHKPGDNALIIPRADLTSRSGTRVLALSRLNARLTGAGVSGLGGDVLAGGEGLPAINARIDQNRTGGWTARLAMADYAVGSDRITIPRLAVRSTPGGTLAFDGLAEASGSLPGGGVKDLAVPLEGTWSAKGGLALGNRCTLLRFSNLKLSGLALAGQQITLCPEGKSPILAFGKTMRFAARSGPLRLSGNLDGSPARLAADRVVLRYPQPFVLDNVDVRIGNVTGEMRLAAANLAGRWDGGVAGEFSGGSAFLGAVPLDLGAIGGRWDYTNGIVTIADGDFTIADRPPEGAARFNPLAARSARLTFDGKAVIAEAMLYHPAANNELARVDLVHRLADASGSARIDMPGVRFDEAFQPEDLCEFAKGVIALADGTITGAGRIDWRGDEITSSGRFNTDGFDFAAAFGPVRSVAGTVEFTDLLNLTTAPDQRLAIGAINPGVEALDGTLQFELKDGKLLSLEDARFPFMGGTLVMRPLVMDFSQPEERRYVFEITGFDAAKFVSQMELTNLGATGIFDGTVPLVFDTDGRGRIEGGVLTARPGGGNVAYIGELTYEDLGALGNYAFAALRSLDYRQMRVGLGGELDGEIITSFEFDGIRQGAGASSNFVTRRLAKLPIRFNVSVRSESFFELTTMVRSFWDAQYVRKPEDIGLFRQENGSLVPANKPVQPTESEDRP